MRYLMKSKYYIKASLFFLYLCLLSIFLLLITISPLTCKEVAKPKEEAKMSTKKLKKEDVRSAAVAGAFYTSDPDALSAQIKDFINKVSAKTLTGKIIALISPHAGYMYSGQVAAYGYKLLEGKKFDTVVVIAPSHRASFNGASLYPKGAYQIPLGLIPINTELAQQLMKQNANISYVQQAHTQEHSIEVQLPFLKALLGDFTLIPIVMGPYYDFATCESLSESIYKVVKDKNVLIVASSDLSHYHPYDTAIKLDKIVIDHVKNFDAKGLFQNISSGRCEACGAGPVITTMLLAKKLGATKSELLKYANSGDVTGDKSGVVGYMAAVLYKNPEQKKDKKAGIDLGLTDQEKKVLHKIAKAAIESRCLGEEYPQIKIPSETLKENRGAFVTLQKHGNLRGCIGYIRAQKPLHETIREMALAAAFQDSRFNPVKKDELKDIAIEISVLTPLKKIDNIEEIEVGKHGIYIIKGLNSGILLPQVATEYGWERKTFLEHTCTKAGLSKDAWKEKDTEIYIYSADIF
jgi:AmmeMemoRadiSam system protein B/AmmeMemoRadiSam system protein A